jgi:hypothetical protein
LQRIPQPLVFHFQDFGHLLYFLSHTDQARTIIIKRATLFCEQ